MGDTDGIQEYDIHISSADASSASITMHGGIGGTFTTSGDIHYTNEHGGLVDSNIELDLGDKDEEISEEVQEKINKLGTPGKRNIDDLLNSFKVVADSKKGSPLEDLDDNTWMDVVMSSDKPLSFKPASEEVISEDIRMGDESES